MAVSGITSSSSLKDIQQSTTNNKNSSSDKSESVTTSKYDQYIKGEDSEDAGIYSSKSITTDNDGYRYRTRQEKKELKEKKSNAFSFGGIFNISAASVFERLLGSNNQQ